MPEAKPLGRFVWFDLMTTDPAAATAFYSRVTGWGTEQFPGPTPYTMWTSDGVPLGGVMQLPPGDGNSPHWLAYISSPDVDKTVKQADDLVDERALHEGARLAQGVATDLGQGLADRVLVRAEQRRAPGNLADHLERLGGARVAEGEHQLEADFGVARDRLLRDQAQPGARHVARARGELHIRHRHGDLDVDVEAGCSDGRELWSSRSRRASWQRCEDHERAPINASSSASISRRAAPTSCPIEASPSASAALDARPAFEVESDHERFDLPARVRRPQSLEVRAYLIGIENELG